MNKIIEFCVSLLFKALTFLRIPEKIAQKLVQFVEFCVVGISNTLISYVIYIIGISFGIHYIIASMLGFVISVTNSFYWNNKYVFKNTGEIKRSIVKSYFKTFLSYAVTGLFLANVLLTFWIEVLHLPQWLGPILNLLVTIPINFLLNKFWAFKNK